MTGGKLLLTLGLAALTASAASAQSIFRDSNSVNSEFVSTIFNTNFGESNETSLFSWFFESPFTVASNTAVQSQVTQPVAELETVGFAEVPESKVAVKVPGLPAPDNNPLSGAPLTPEASPSDTPWDTSLPDLKPIDEDEPVARTPIFIPAGPFSTEVFSND